MKRSVFAAILLFSLIAIWAPPVCLSASVSKAPPPTHARASDPELQRVIQAKLAKSKIGKDGLTFKVKGGVVTWEGSTNVIQHKGAATRMARSAGAAQVVNNIKISDAARAKAASNLQGGLRRAQVKTN
ncbi:MAG: BON domain-containing protein [Acidobacteriaceae bacterium]|nr:BON domain-containing protein [Acidobacteriaceae bacterium]